MLAEIVRRLYRHPWVLSSLFFCNVEKMVSALAVYQRRQMRKKTSDLEAARDSAEIQRWSVIFLAGLLLPPQL